MKSDPPLEFSHPADGRPVRRKRAQNAAPPPQIGLARFDVTPPSTDQYAITKLALLASSAAGVILLGVMLSFPGEIVMHRARLDANSANERVLDDRLTQLRAAWDPRVRARILDEAPTLAPQLAGTLQRVLRLDRYELREQAIEFAGAMRAADLRPAVVAALDDARPSTRQHALRAADRIATWSSEELANFIMTGTPDLRLGALELCHGRADAPWQQVIDGLFDDEEPIRNAALQAIAQGSIPTPAVLDHLWRCVGHEDSTTAAIALAALARFGGHHASALCEHVVPLLRNPDANIRAAALDLLVTGSAQSDDATAKRAIGAAIWSVADDANEDTEVREHALRALERTAAIDVERVQQRIFGFEPRARLLAARCLFVAGAHQPAVQTWLDLLDPGAEVAADVVTASRQLLGFLTGCGPSSSRETFEDAWSRRSGAHARELPPNGP